jgi:signal peptidase II
MLRNMNLIKRIFPLPLNNSALIWLPLAVFGLIADQFTKYFALQYLYMGSSVNIFAGFNFGFDLALVYNYGAAFGFLNNGKTWQVLLLMSIALIAIIGFAVWLARIPKEQQAEGIGIVLILSGALGNLIDRVYHGYVIDFLDVYIGNSHWPAFNLADSFICIGAVLVLLQIFRKEEKTQ